MLQMYLFFPKKTDNIFSNSANIIPIGICYLGLNSYPGVSEVEYIVSVTDDLREVLP
jgi:hypothetical protein